MLQGLAAFGGKTTPKQDKSLPQSLQEKFKEEPWTDKHERTPHERTLGGG